MRVHYCRVRRDGPPKDIVGVGKVDDDDLVLLTDLLPNTNEVVRLEGQCLHRPGLINEEKPG